MGIEIGNSKACYGPGTRQRRIGWRAHQTVPGLSAPSGHDYLFQRFHNYGRKTVMSRSKELRMSHINKKKAWPVWIAIVVLLTMCTTSIVLAQDPHQFPDITAISLEDLMNLKVTSVSKREQKL